MADYGLNNLRAMQDWSLLALRSSNSFFKFDMRRKVCRQFLNRLAIAEDILAILVAEKRAAIG